MNIWLQGQVIHAKRVLEDYPDVPYEVAVQRIKEAVSCYSGVKINSDQLRLLDRRINRYQEIASAYARLSCVPLRDHLEEVKVIWSYDKGKVMEETTLWVPIKLTLAETDLRVAGTVRLLEEGVGMREIDSLEVVLNQ